MILRWWVLLFCIWIGAYGVSSAQTGLATDPHEGSLTFGRGRSLPRFSTPLSLDENYRGHAIKQEETTQQRAEKKTIHPPTKISNGSLEEKLQRSTLPAAPAGSKRLMILFGMVLLFLFYLINRNHGHSQGSSLEGSEPLTYGPSANERNEQALDFAPTMNVHRPPIHANQDPDACMATEGMRNETSFDDVRRQARRQGKLDVAQLIYLLETTHSPYHHSRGLYLLGQYGVSEALPMLLKEMSHTHPWVRLAAASALVHLRTPIIEERMIEMAEDYNPLIRATAITVLARIGTSRSHDILRRSIWDFEPEIREKAVLAIGRLCVPNADFELKESMKDIEEVVAEKAAWVYHRVSQRLQGQG